MNEEVYVIEVNPRSSRTVPYISKVTGIPIVILATKVIIGHTIRGLGYEPGLAPRQITLPSRCRYSPCEELGGRKPPWDGGEIPGGGVGVCKDLQRGSLQSIPRRRNQPAEIQKHDHHRKG